MRNSLLLLACLFSLSALADPAPKTLAVHLSTGAALFQAYTLDGTTRPPALGYSIGATFVHLKINDGIYDLSAEGVGFLSLGGAASAGAVLCVAPHEGGWMGGTLCGGAGLDVFNAQTGRGIVQGHFRWDSSMPLLVSAGLHF
jgi:hypothetical protein